MEKVLVTDPFLGGCVSVNDVSVTIVHLLRVARILGNFAFSNFPGTRKNPLYNNNDLARRSDPRFSRFSSAAALDPRYKNGNLSD